MTVDAKFLYYTYEVTFVIFVLFQTDCGDDQMLATLALILARDPILISERKFFQKNLIILDQIISIFQDVYIH